jgi:precorrin-2 dehydrogenase
MPITAPVYHAALIVEGRPCLVVGAGHVGARKAEGLLAAGAQVRVVATEVGEAVRDLKGLAGIEQRPYRRGEVAAYRLAITATGDPGVNRAVFEDGEAAGVFVNAADDPASCSFILPAVARQGAVSVAISTGGHSPALASWLKGHVVREMGPEIAELATLLADARARARAAGRSTEDVDWRPALDWSMLELIRSGRRAEAKERLEACLSL